MKLMQLMKFNEKSEENLDIEVINSAQAKDFRHTVFTIEKQVEFQKELVYSL